MSKPAIANADQSEAWNGATGAKWVRFQDQLDNMLSPYRDALMDAASIAAGSRLLDIGCGCGDTTLAAAKFTGPKGRALGIDLSAPMTVRARERSAALNSSAEFEVADASNHDFGKNAFDLMISRFGVMFFDDPVGAFTNLHRATTADGRLIFICWRPLSENEWISAPMSVARPLLPPLPPVDPYAPGPGAFAEAPRVKDILEKAGFRNVTHRAMDLPLVLGKTLDEALEQALEIGPLSRLLAEQDDALRAKAAAAIREKLATYLTPQGVTLGSSTWIVSANA